MPRPRKYANAAERQAAYVVRCAERVANVTPIEVDASHENWSTAVHEAGHAVMQIRERGVEGVDKVRLINNSFVYQGMCHCGDFVPATTTVAGHFAEKRWGNGLRRTSLMSGTSQDFREIVNGARDHRHYIVEKNHESRDFRTRWKRPAVKKVDRKEASKTWNRTMRNLRALADRDPSFERQVKTVAAELCKRGVLTGVEVGELMGVTKLKTKGATA
jgi:hypothetical protein